METRRRDAKNFEGIAIERQALSNRGGITGKSRCQNE